MQDIRLALRRFSRSPGLWVAVIVSIGLGVGANATIFSIVSSFLLRPPAVGEPATLVSVFTTRHGDCCGNNLSWPLFNDLRDQARSFSGLTAFYPSMPTSIGGSSEPVRVWGALAEFNYFDVNQIQMALGRGFHRDEEDAPVVVLSYHLWANRFGADPAILGKAVNVSGHPFTVIGVAPSSFRGLDIYTSDLWVPLGNKELLMPRMGNRSRSNTWLEVAGRLAPGVTSIAGCCGAEWNRAAPGADLSGNRKGQRLSPGGCRISASGREGGPDRLPLRALVPWPFLCSALRA